MSESSSTVSVVCWDISAGVVGTVFGQWILYATSRSKEMAPEAIDHVGLVVFDRLYEFGDTGVLMSEDLVAPDTLEIASRYPVSSVRSREEVGVTHKTEKEFHKWLSDMDDGAFMGSRYHVVDNSCVVWAIAACGFLGVQHPPNWDKILDWAKKNEKVANIFGKVGIHSRAGSEMVNPTNLGKAKAYKKSNFMFATMKLFSTAIVPPGMFPLQQLVPPSPPITPDESEELEDHDHDHDQDQDELNSEVQNLQL